MWQQKSGFKTEIRHFAKYFAMKSATLMALTKTHNVSYKRSRVDKCHSATFIDLKRAFDTIDHEILLSKLELYGLKVQALSFSETTSLIELRLQL